MPRPWGKLHAPMLSHRKFLRMTRAERGDWLTLLLAAINSTKDDDLGTADDVRSILRSFGNARPDDTIEQMLNLRLLDRRIDDGHLLLHDWADHQPDDPTGAKRKAAERAAARARHEPSSSRDSHATVAGQSADSPQTVTRTSSDLSRESRSRDGDGDGDGEETPQPPASGGGRPSRANGTSRRQVAEREAAERSAADEAKRWRRNQRHLAYQRGALTEAQQRDQDERDAPLEEIPDHAEHQARLRAEAAEAEDVSWLSGKSA